MREFIKRNRIISLFGLISILISVSYAATYNMPDYFGIESWYSLLNNISISYVAALIFYILQVYKPDRENNKRAHTILSPQFSELAKFLEIVISCCRKFVVIDDNGHAEIRWSDADRKVIYFVPFKEGKDEKRPAIRKSESDLLQLEKTYREKIKDLKERISFRSCDPEILNVVSELEADEFFKSTIHTTISLQHSFITAADFHNSVDRFEVLKDRYKKCCGISDTYLVRDPQDMERISCDAIMDNRALQSVSVDAFNELVLKMYIKDKLKENQINDENLLNQLADQVYALIQEKK